MKVIRIVPIFLFGCMSASALALTLSQSPLFVASTEPRVMLVASRDHQLSIKAYTDYTDVDSSGTLDTTYSDSINYYGYFATNKCYTYTSSRFEPSGLVTTGHQCSNAWSGNFMNWASMTRMDILRKTFYGGYRSTDTATSGSTNGETVLERHFLPNDIHAFAKVYNAGTNANLIRYVPSAIVGTNTAISLCNVTDTNSTTLSGQMAFPLAAPLIKVAAGSFPQWDSSESVQCQLNGGTQPTALLGTYNARIKVCNPADSLALKEDNCKDYVHPTTNAKSSKPTGLLQKYGDIDAERRVRFGLMTGSYNKNKSGGVLRKNVGLLANNQNLNILSGTVCGNQAVDSDTTTPAPTNDEIDVCTGIFLNQDSNKAGIINTLNRLHIAGFQYSSTLGSGGAHRYNCDSPGKLSFADGDCVDWGNPLAETYLEALRYFAVDGAGTVVDAPGVPSSVFDTSDASKLSSIPQVAWVDPIPANQWCAISNIVVMSTGLNSFDTDQLASFTPRNGSTAINANTLTHTVGDSSHEDINGRSYLVGNLIGGTGTSANNQCTAKTSVDLDKVKGICPEVPSTEGGYGIAGLAYAPKTIDLRPDYATQRAARWGGSNPINPDWAARQPLDTYAVQLGDTLPSFSVSVGSGLVTILPSCQANSNGSTAAWTAATSANWRNCSMTNLVINDNVAMASVGTSTANANTCSGNGNTSRCFTVAWEDSTWGNDYDMDGIQRLGFCLGSACSTFKMLCPTTASATATIGPFSSVSSTQVVVATCATQANAGHALSFGYTLTGTTSSGAFYPILRPGGQNFNVGSVLPSSTITAPNSATFDASSTASANLLKSPLWYAAKYGGFLESTPTAGTPTPNLQSEWDLKNNFTGATGPDGEPDNYFNVRNPSTLITALSNVFDKATQRSGDAASAATNSTNLRAESRIYQAKFSSVDWSGQLQSFLFSGGVLNTTTPEWDAGTVINTQNWSTGRVILTKGAAEGIPFRFANLSGPTATTGSQQDLLDRNAAGNKDNCGSERVNYLRGDNTNEGTTTSSFTCGSGTTITKFRTRNTSKLGDIVNSNPLYIAAPSAGFSDSDHPGYGAFFTSQARRTPIVYAGSNDGMLHGFDASLTFPTGNLVGVPSPTAGKEVLAYIPSALIGNLSKLTDQSYNKNHLYFVDGSPMSGDVDLGTANWRTILVGALGGGGKGYYALNITNPPATNPLNTNPSTFSETGTDPKNTVMWEFGRNDDIDVGFAFNFPPTSGTTSQAKQIVKMANGKWAVIVGNGYNSTNGKAVLYVLFFADGLDGTLSTSDFVKIVADTGTNNGLSTPVPYDSDDDGFVDTVYAGDLKGKLWKFLVGPNASDTSVTSTTSTWKVAFSGAPLFSATDSGGTVQPIIAPPEVTDHPNGGLMVMFGTGKYIETSDITSTAVQTFYGIWDKHNGTTTVGARNVDLLQQTATVSTDGKFRTLGTNLINWRTGTGNSVNNADCTPAATCNPSHRGWYFDLPVSKERTTGISKLINNVIFFNSLIPSDAPCDGGGSGWLMAVDYLSGGKVPRKIFDTNNDNKVGKEDIIVSGVKTAASIGGSIFIQNRLVESTTTTGGSSGSSGSGSVGIGGVSPHSNVGHSVTTTTTGKVEDTVTDFGSGTGGRLSWREVVQ